MLLHSLSSHLSNGRSIARLDSPAQTPSIVGGTVLTVSLQSNDANSLPELGADHPRSEESSGSSRFGPHQIAGNPRNRRPHRQFPDAGSRSGSQGIIGIEACS